MVSEKKTIWLNMEFYLESEIGLFSLELYLQVKVLFYKTCNLRRLCGLTITRHSNILFPSTCQYMFIYYIANLGIYLNMYAYIYRCRHIIHMTQSFYKTLALTCSNFCHVCCYYDYHNDFSYN